MKRAMLFAACACVAAAPPPVQAGGIGNAVGRFVCATIPV